MYFRILKIQNNIKTTFLRKKKKKIFFYLFPRRTFKDFKYLTITYHLIFLYVIYFFLKIRKIKCCLLDQYFKINKYLELSVT